ncbi:D-methionine transport system substrate-binding protein [Desulfohalotomaculum tongense]|uniref:MetQ/NlpA family ABC transporter substrate-binding protein n=1 Tax=Desulforadius tongensis TaxID=1216062 RepID=UPI00195C84FA|nr:MetQ/NlpA family ABC transporter substrate-binding protein [Desulforadius tongensis]MBM7854041.1 D-methionine transport system substrate-binding protein [Desulforadius tongensis]
MKKIVVVLALLLALVAAGCGEKDAAGDGVLTVGATEVPHAEILKVVEPILEKEGVKLDIKVFSDYTTPNLSLDAGDLDANFFQHQPYLDDFNEKKGTKLVSIAKIHFEPMGLYSKKVSGIDEFKEGAKIGIPGDATNGGRALVLLEKAGLIKLKEGVGIEATVRDIVDKKVEIIETEAAQLPRSLEDLDGAVINGNYAVQAGLTPGDALAAEDASSEAADTYGNILVVRKGDENREELKKLAKALQSEEVKEFIKEKYNGAVIPVF